MHHFYLPLSVVVVVTLNVLCVDSLPTKNQEKVTTTYTVTPEYMSNLRGSELQSALDASKVHDHHLNESAKLHPLNPAQVYHKVKGAQALRKFNSHCKTLECIKLAEDVGVIKEGNV